MKIFQPKRLFVLFIICFAFLQSFSQENYNNYFKYLSPLPNSVYVSPQNNIAFRLNENKIAIQPGNISIVVKGDISRNIAGEEVFSSSSGTFLFKPNNAFNPGEKVEVEIRNEDPSNKFTYSYQFTVSSTSKKLQRNALTDLYEKEDQQMDLYLPNYPSVSANSSVKENKDLPEINITHSDNPSPGNIFFATIGNKKDRGNGLYMMIVDNEATPVFYRELEAGIALDFKLQPSGYLSYYNSADSVFYLMNDFFEVVDQVNTGNGYIADRHELQQLENGHSFLMAYDPQVVDMSEIVPGGEENAIVIGLIIQELDSQKNVIFQWRSWDHINITDASNEVNLTADLIDYVHGNAIEVQSDTSILISSRNLDEVTKIDRQTANIIWRLNGKGNMFSKPPASDMFCKQHDVRIMPGSENHISVFDNGNCHSPKQSSAAEYFVDEENMNVSLVKRLRSIPDIYGPFMGNAQRLTNGNTIVGWGAGIPNITEFDEDGNIMLQMSFDYMNYRAFKFEWTNNVMSVDNDTLNFETISPGDSAFMSITITNNYSSTININNIINKEEAFTVQNNLPVQIQPQASKTFNILFKPGTTGSFKSLITFCWDKNEQNIAQRISRQILVKGIADEVAGNFLTAKQDGFQIYPNPFANSFSIKLDGKKISQLQIINNLGQVVHEENNINKLFYQLSPEMEPGIYLAKIKTMDGEVLFSKLVHQ